jgi:hypothetical protein
MLESFAAEATMPPRLSREVDELEVSVVTSVMLTEDEEVDRIPFSDNEGSVDFAFVGTVFDL